MLFDVITRNIHRIPFSVAVSLPGELTIAQRLGEAHASPYVYLLPWIDLHMGVLGTSWGFRSPIRHVKSNTPPHVHTEYALAASPTRVRKLEEVSDHRSRLPLEMLLLRLHSELAPSCAAHERRIP